MEREALLKQWNEAWETGLWAAAWKKSLDGLTSAQAAWKPGPQRHSIWQIVEHVTYWREVALNRTAGGEGPSEEEVAQRNFPQPVSATEAAWQDLVRRFGETQRQVAAALQKPATKLEQLQYLVPHDCYHFGQVAYLRALQGLPSAG